MRQVELMFIVAWRKVVINNCFAFESQHNCLSAHTAIDEVSFHRLLLFGREIVIHIGSKGFYFWTLLIQCFPLLARARAIQQT
jgi:hypothetical protein